MTTPPGPDEPRYATGYGGARYPLPPEGAPFTVFTVDEEERPTGRWLFQLVPPN